jgi:hypothetical protein
MVRVTAKSSRSILRIKRLNSSDRRIQESSIGSCFGEAAFERSRFWSDISSRILPSRANYATQRIVSMAPKVSFVSILGVLSLIPAFRVESLSRAPNKGL